MSDLVQFEMLNQNCPNPANNPTTPLVHKPHTPGIKGNQLQCSCGHVPCTLNQYFTVHGNKALLVVNMYHIFC